MAIKNWNMARHASRLGTVLLFLVTCRAFSGPLETLAPGMWYEVPNSALSGVNPCATGGGCSYSANEGLPAVIDDWNGGALATRYGEKGGYIVWGGGHSGYFGNEVYVFDIAQLKWVRVSEPVNNPVCDYVEGELQDGSPCSSHTYDTVGYHPGTNSFIRLTSTANHVKGAEGSSPRVHLFSLDTKTWRRGANKPTFYSGPTGATSAYDPNRGVFWLLYAFNADLSKYDPNGNSGAGQWSEHARFNINTSAAGAIDPVHDLYVVVEGSLERAIFVFDLKNPDTPGVRVTTAGDTTLQNSIAPGFEWDPISQAFVGWTNGPDVYKLTPPSGDWRTGTWQWNRVPPAAGNTVVPTAKNVNNTYSRWQYVPSVNAFVVVNRSRDNVFFYKMNNAPPVVDPTIALTADAASVASGGGTTLRWTVTNATACTASNGWTGTKATTGSQAVGPLTAASTTFTLACSNTGGGLATGSVVVSVTATPAPVVSLTASSTTVATGSSANLTWSATGATSCTASGDSSWTGSKAIGGGTLAVGPINSATTYSLSCTGAGGTSATSVAIAVSATPTTPPPTQPPPTSAATATDSGGGGMFAPAWVLSIALLAIARHRKLRVAVAQPTRG